MKKQFLSLLAVLIAVTLVVPAVAADQHTNTTANDTDADILSLAEARTVAENALQQNTTWVLDSAERDDNTYEFEFIVQDSEREAEITVDARTGDVLSFEQDKEADEEAERDDEAEEDVEENESEETVSTLDEARERIQALRQQIRSLQAELADLRNNQSSREDLPEQASERAQEARERRGLPEDVPRGQGQTEQEVQVEAEQENGEQEVEVEAERTGPSQQSRDNINGTPRENSNRPGFVTRMLQRTFG
jgi:uncharacterized membrane protein YkoI